MKLCRQDRIKSSRARGRLPRAPFPLSYTLFPTVFMVRFIPWSPFRTTGDRGEWSSSHARSISGPRANLRRGPILKLSPIMDHSNPWNMVQFCGICPSWTSREPESWSNPRVFSDSGPHSDLKRGPILKFSPIMDHTDLRSVVHFCGKCSSWTSRTPKAWSNSWLFFDLGPRSPRFCGPILPRI